MMLDNPDATTGQYDEVMALIGVAENPPAGLISHTAGSTGDGLVVVDVWDDANAFGVFAETRLRPAVSQVGIQELQPRILPVHNLIREGAGSDPRVMLLVDLPRF